MANFQQYLDRIQNPTPEFTRTLQFFLVFSRFEYALKYCGYIRVRGTDLSADWGGFASAIETGCSADTKARLYDAGALLFSEPPGKQVLNTAGQLDWQFDTLPKSIENLFVYIRRVRNNLFHGGKFASAPVTDPARNSRLVEACITCLTDTLILDPAIHVKTAYDSEVF